MTNEQKMRKALECLLDRYVDLVNSGDAGFWNPEEESQVISAREALAQQPAAVVELTDQEMAKAVRHLCASDEVAMEFVDLSRDEYLAIIAAHIAKQGGSV